MDDSQKLSILSAARIKPMRLELQRLLDEFETLLKREREFRNENAEYLAPQGHDCQAVKYAVALLEPPLGGDKKKLTVAQADAWIQRQRRENPELAQEIATQRSAQFALDDILTRQEMTRRRIDALKATMACIEASFRFLGG